MTNSCRAGVEAECGEIEIELRIDRAEDADRNGNGERDG